MPRRQRQKPGSLKGASRKKAVALYGEGDEERPLDEQAGKTAEPYRSAWRRDYARLIHSPCFRRLQGKTQVFPGQESDFYRNRLTHSLEVAQIAKSIAIRLNNTERAFARRNRKIEPDIVEFAGLAHDLGHPPFGHNGEEALDECMRDHGGFEGNAQSLRIISRLEKKIISGSNADLASVYGESGDDRRGGLNISFRSLAAVLKYDRAIPERYSDRVGSGVNKGYYFDDVDLVNRIKTNILGVSNYVGKFKTIECSIMDVSDDIAYSTYDLEDNFKAGFLSPIGLFGLNKDIYEAVAATMRGRVDKWEEQGRFEGEKPVIDADLVQRILFAAFYEVLFGGQYTTRLTKKALDAFDRFDISSDIQSISNLLANDGFHRTKFTSKLVQLFLNGIEIVPHKSYPQLHNIRLEFWTFLFVETLKNITYHTIIRSPFLQVVEYRGKEIVKSIFRALNDHDGTRLLPADFQFLCKESDELKRMRTICDFIAGMTDRYAFEFYDRLFGSSRLTIHKPL